MSAARLLTRAASRALPILARQRLVRPVGIFARHFASEGDAPGGESSPSWNGEQTSVAQKPEPAPLPALPEVEPYPTPLLTQEDIMNFLLPLYERGWYVTTKGEHRALERKLRFRAYRSIIDFVNDLAGPFMTEGHHPDISFGHKNFRLATMTHTARAEDSAPASGPTLRDVRLALLVEGLRDRYAADGRLFPEPTKEPRANPRTLDDVLKRTPGRNAPSLRRRMAKRCFVCKSDGHQSRDCPDRYTAKPETPCGYCGGEHFAINCTKLGDPAVRPLKPCGTCGDWHWSSLCPHKQTPTETENVV